MPDPSRFVAMIVDGEGGVVGLQVLRHSNDPQEVQRAAEAYAERTREPVHLYQHVISVQVSEDGN